jgi:hypothetical protein
MSIGPTQHQVLRDRLRNPQQVTTEESVDALPPYLDAFLAHLRLLVGVPFQHLVPDARLLPDESIRFFYLDRSWTDRLVDGAVAVGKIGTRELAHAQTQLPAVQRSVDDSESLVRGLQRGTIADYTTAKADPTRARVEADVVTGFLVRSALVSGWPHLEVRASRAAAPLTTLRLERLSPAVLVALFRGVPDRVELEEPHHGVQFGIFLDEDDPTHPTAAVRDATGTWIHTGAHGETVDVPMRAGRKNVVDVAALRRRMHAAVGQSRTSTAIPQTGSGALAIALLRPPWLQPFGAAGAGALPSTPKLPVAERVRDAKLEQAIRLHLGGSR